VTGSLLLVTIHQSSSTLMFEADVKPASTQTAPLPMGWFQMLFCEKGQVSGSRLPVIVPGSGDP
jgi:hypothetical protein